MNQWESVVSLDKYPLLDLKSDEGQALLVRCRESLAQDGACELQDFLTPSALAQMVAESQKLEANAHRNTLVGNAYLEDVPKDVPEDHPKKMLEPTTLGAVAYDEIPKRHLLRQLFEWDPLMHFIGAVLELDAIYRYGDPMGALNVSVMVKGDYLRWHFDQTDFVTSIALQMSESGGAFEYVPMLREPGRECFDAVKSVLQGDRTRVVHLPNKPGSLVLFKGRYSLHRVAEVTGDRSRLVALLSYDTKPDTAGSDYLRLIRYGRTHVKPSEEE